jgi:DNA-binding NarL/FixJ family response regulator
MEIFLVEDSAILRKRLCELLAQIPGADVVGTATGAKDAIAGILEHRPDVAVVDIHLAEGTGFEVLRELRDRAPEVNVYMLSNFSSEPYRRLAASLGAAAFFDKSTEFERVREQLAERAAQCA